MVIPIKLCYESEIKLVNRKKSGKTSFQQQYLRWKKKFEKLKVVDY